jgi:multidrug efflux system membrane fusion protein
LEFFAAKKLSQKGFKAETKYAAAFADLQAAKAFAERIRINLEYTNIHAPFSGVLSAQSAEIGDVLRKSDPVAELIDLDPLLITAYVSERDYPKIKMGQSAEVKLRNEKKINGRIQFISPVAQRDTRTFKVELETPNPRAQIPEGITAELILPLPETLAHQLSPSLFSLDENGNLGIKIINEEGRVQFKPIKIVGGSEDKTFVTGLPDLSNVIVVGQGFVMHGQIVKAVAETASSGKQS